MCCSKHSALYLHEIRKWIFYLDVARWLCASQCKQVVKFLFYICVQQAEKLIWKPFCSWTLSFVIFPSTGFLIWQENYFDEFNRVCSKVGAQRAQQGWQQGWCLPLHLVLPSLPSALHTQILSLRWFQAPTTAFASFQDLSAVHAIYSRLLFIATLFFLAGSECKLPSHFSASDPLNPLFSFCLSRSWFWCWWVLSWVATCELAAVMGIQPLNPTPAAPSFAYFQ